MRNEKRAKERNGDKRKNADRNRTTEKAIEQVCGTGNRIKMQKQDAGKGCIIRMQNAKGQGHCRREFNLTFKSTLS